MNFLISAASENLFKLAFILEDWVGLPAKMSESLYFRRAWKKYLKTGVDTLSPALWIHGASVGELENLANFFLDPEALGEAGYRPDQVIVTASSISARELLEKLQKNESFRYAGPLPPESQLECRDFLKTLNPELLLMSHTDLWPCLMKQSSKFLKKGCLWLPKSVPSGRILEKQFLYPMVRSVGLNRSEDLKTEWNLRTQFVGNPRLDRVSKRIALAEKLPHPLQVKASEPRAQQINVLIGSCWSEDAAIWAEAFDQLSKAEKDRFFIVAIPHDISDTHEVARIQSLMPWAKVLPVSGVLLESYRGFDLAFVGGGYRSGLHSIVEPALWAIPVACGPLVKAQIEASRLIEQNSLFIVPEAGALKSFLVRLTDANELKKIKADALRSKQLLEKDLGATKRLINLIKQEAHKHDSI